MSSLVSDFLRYPLNFPLPHGSDLLFPVTLLLRSAFLPRPFGTRGKFRVTKECRLSIV